ncbi:MAG TPA: BadF/BadG/BcrA/BcrD ATPase family protein [Candidatus Polarisedimenticolaceae bacterium]|nr:BadF/BadG/BcrA/BcrD ATPase family protein [Candidatus Polarisedimenticolaceae bacterium]
MTLPHCVGIDLGSTTTKAVVLAEDGSVLGRGITNSRSNYAIACQVALSEALIAARFGLLAREMDEGTLAAFALLFRGAQYRGQLRILGRILLRIADRSGLEGTVEAILGEMDGEAPALFAAGASRKSDFFRDLAGSRYLALAEDRAREQGLPFDRLAGLFDKAILEAENVPAGEESFAAHAQEALDALSGAGTTVSEAVRRAASVRLEQVGSVGTGYGRQTLPFPREQIRSEILCHGLGAHAMFPGTRTVLDIGGQDTKAIQVDGDGIVTSFQMNDRCAAGCGRYLGYIADEMNLGLHQLGPMACASTRPVRINSTCTVFAGAELRERLSLGEKREDILAGLHRAIVLRAMSLLARSGGIADEFTFTGGVARNPAAVAALAGLVEENYGRLTTNISPDSIYTGALGAALFAHREWRARA